MPGYFQYVSIFSGSLASPVGSGVSGAAVGCVVGEAVGFVLGEAVGSVLGDAVGRSVGGAVGGVVVGAVGSTLGGAVGSVVVGAVGSTLGDADGSVLGEEEGSVEAVGSGSFSSAIASIGVNARINTSSHANTLCFIPVTLLFRSYFKSDSFEAANRSITKLRIHDAAVHGVDHQRAVLPVKIPSVLVIA